MDQWIEASFIQGVWSLIYLFSICLSPLPPLPVLKFEFSLNPHSELAQRSPVPHTHLPITLGVAGGEGEPGSLVTWPSTYQTLVCGFLLLLLLWT